MKKSLVTITLLLFIIFIMPIVPSGTDAYTNNGALADTSQRNPNGSSELALLMREMQSYTHRAKAHLNTDTVPETYPQAFDKLHSATVTPGISKNDFFNTFADVYLKAVKDYSGSNAGNRTETYNAMVSACLSCHAEHCPGPVPVIKKMMWDPK